MSHLRAHHLAKSYKGRRVIEDVSLDVEAGQIVERGRHADLLATAGRYAEMWQRQQAAAESEAKAAPEAEPAVV